MTGEEERPFEVAVDELLRPAALADSQRVPNEGTGYIAWGEYGRILGGYLDVFGRDRLLVLFTQDLGRAPEQVLSRICTFLGVESSFVPDNLGARYREGGSRRRIPWLSLGVARAAIAGSQRRKELWYSVPYGLRSRIDGAYERAAYLVELWNRRSDPGTLEVALAVRDRLREHFLPDGELLANQLGLAPHWLDEWTRT